jgi:hypothetical protein
MKVTKKGSKISISAETKEDAQALTSTLRAISDSFEVQKYKQGIEKIDRFLETVKTGSMEWLVQKQNRQFLVNQLFQKVGMTDLLKLDVLEDPTV